jgi:DNA repair protein RecO (recombination protein O)
MAIFKDRGVVLKEHAEGEADRRLTLLLHGRGKAAALARGAKKPGSGLRACALFSYCDFVIYDGGGFLSVTQADVIEPFFNVGAGYEIYRHACAALELADRAYYPEMPAGEALGFLLIALRAFDKGAAPPPLILAAFIFRLLKLEGFAPVFSGCAECGREDAFFFGGSGPLCGACASGRRNVPLSGSARRTLRGVLEGGAKDYSDGDAPALLSAAALFLEINVGVELKSLL